MSVPDPFDEAPSDPFEQAARAGRAHAEGADAADAWQALRDGLGAAAAASEHGSGEMQCVELCPICRAADILRASGPPELRGQINEFQREALTTLRALLDHYIERLDTPQPASGTVEDIPID